MASAATTSVTPPIDKNTRILVSEFLEVFFNRSGYKWLLTQRDASKFPYVFVLPESHYVFSGYKEGLNYAEIARHYRNALNDRTANYRTDTGLPILEVSHMDHFINGRSRSATLVACLMLLCSLLAAEYMMSNNAVNINPIVNKLSVYFTKHANWLNPLGGWKEFWEKFVLDVRFLETVRDTFDDLKDFCIEQVFTGRFRAHVPKLSTKRK